MRLSPSFALCASLLASPVFAQKVVILELDGDSQGKLRVQIEAGLKSAGVVELIPLKAFKDAAAKKRLKGGAAMTPVGVARASTILPLDVGVGGEVTATTFKVVFYDRSGEQLGTKELAVKKGLLSEEILSKLVRAIGVVGKVAADRAATPQPSPVQEGGVGEVPVEPATPESGRVVVTGKANPEVQPAPDPAPVPDQATPEERDVDLDQPNRRRKAARIPVRMFRLWVAGTTTWRSQCLRPGVSSCKEYELLQNRPAGISIDITPAASYAGVTGVADVFPFARFDSRIAQGFGVLLGFAYGRSQTSVMESGSQGNGPKTTIVSDDWSLAAQLAWRFHFQMGWPSVDPSTAQRTPPSHWLDPQQPVGWLGLRGGLMSRRFLIDPKAETVLPSSDRVFPTGLGFPVIGLDASLPLLHFVRLELSGTYFFNPRPAAEQIVGYGNLSDPSGGATTTGLGLEIGVAGDIISPLGYSIRYRYMTFTDRYFGQGQKWTTCNETQCHGVGEETFSAIIWGLTASF